MTPSLLLRSSSPDGFIFYCAIGICAGIFLFLRGFRLLQRRHLILDTPVSKIRSASLGMVELNGLAVGPNTLIAPITSRPCYYHRTLVWEWKQSGRNKKWVKVAAECQHVPFFLDDNTAKVMIDPQGADLDLHRDFQEEFCDSLFTIKEEVPDNVRSFLLRHCVSTTNKIKVEEFCIKPKNALFVLGTLDENPGLELTPEPIQDDETTGFIIGNAFSFSLNPERLRARLAPVIGDGNLFTGVLTGGLQHDPAFDATYEQALSTASARIAGQSPHPQPTKSTDMTQQEKVAAALMQAGISNTAAGSTRVTSAAGATPSAGVTPAAGVTPSATPQSSADFDPCPPVVLMKGKNNPTFLISWRSQRDLARSLAWKCTAMIWGGPALALLSLYILLTITHAI